MSIRLVNVGTNTIYLNDGQSLQYNNVYVGQSIDVPESLLSHPQIESCLRSNWLAQVTVPQPAPGALIPSSQPPTGARVDNGVVVGPGNAEAPRPMPISYPGVQGQDAVNLRGFVPRMPEINEDTTVVPHDISNADSIITGRQVQDVNTPQVQQADAMIRGNTPAPAYHEMPGPVAADSVMRQVRVPGQPQNTAVAQPGVPVQGQAGGVSRQATPAYQVVRPASRVPLPRPAFNPAPPSAGNMGWTVPYSHVPTQREPVDIEQMAEMSPENIEADTNARLLDSKRRQEVATITSNYREMDAQKRGAVVINCQDLNLLYRLLGMETAATVSAYIQNKILELGGRLPTAEEMQQIQQANATTSGAPAQLQPVIAPSLFQPATTPLNPMRDLITRYVMGEMAGQEKVAFIPKLRDLDQLNKLLKIEGSDGIKAMISAQITQVQAVVQAAEAAPNMPGRPTTAPLKPEEVVMDKTLTPPPAPGCTCGNLQMQNGQLVFTQDGGNPVTTAPDGKVQCPKCGGWMAMPGSPAAVAPTPVTPPALPTNEPSANGPQA